MFLNIITPCVKPDNLWKIAETINIPEGHFRWIVVFDLNELPDSIPEICETYLSSNPQPIDGSASKGDWQRNFGIELVDHGHVYFNDDDSSLHPDLWSNIEYLDANDFISFDQSWNNGFFRLKGSHIDIGHIDSHNFICDSDIIVNSRWRLDVYESDGFFAKEVHSRAVNPIYIPKVLSVFNSLDDTRFVVSLEEVENWLNSNDIQCQEVWLHDLWPLSIKNDYMFQKSLKYDSSWPAIVSVDAGGNFRKIIWGHEVIIKANVEGKAKVNVRFLDLGKAPVKFNRIFQ